MHKLKFRATLENEKVIDVTKIDFTNKKIEYMEDNKIKVASFKNVKRFEYVNSAYTRILYFKN